MADSFHSASEKISLGIIVVRLLLAVARPTVAGRRIPFCRDAAIATVKQPAPRIAVDRMRAGSSKPGQMIGENVLSTLAPVVTNDGTEQVAGSWFLHRDCPFFDVGGTISAP